VTPGWWGVTRAGLVVLAGTALAYAAIEVPGTVNLVPAVEQAVLPSPTQAAVVTSSLSCAGPETEGLTGVPPVAATTIVYASTPPAEVLSTAGTGSAAGTLTVTSTPSNAAVGRSDRLGALVEGPLSGPSVGLVTASGSLAPGVAALQTSVVTKGDDRAAVATPCTEARPELWLVAGGAGSTRRERVVLTNPGANPVSADVTVLGSNGLLPSANGQHVSVAPHGRTSLLVDALVGPESTPVIHVVATGGVVTGVVEDSWVDGAIGRGADDAIPSAAPAPEQIIPAVYLDGPARLRVAVPGGDEAVVQARALTSDGPTALPGDGVLRIPGGSVGELELGELPPGAYALQVRADQPIVAGAMVERRPGDDKQSDFGWTTGTTPIAVVAGTPLPPNATASLLLVSTGDASSATVYTVSATGAVESRAYAVAADSVADVDVSNARQVWIRQPPGTLRAGLALGLAAATEEPLFSLVPINPGLVSTTQVPVHQVPG
jgi:hypothetical protein